MSIPHPIPYQGSKRLLADKILSYFPVDIDTLIEPFAGSAAISIATASRDYARRYWINDVNEALMLLWHDIINHPYQLATFYDALWHKQLGHEKSFYNKVRDRFNQTHRSYYFLYLLARCVKASVRYNTDGEFNQSPDNRRKGRKPDTMQRDIVGVSHLLQERIRLSSWDYREVLQYATYNDLVYMDPPYQGVSNTSDPRYMMGINYEEFVQALADLNARQIPYVVSYDGRTGRKSFGQPLPDFLDLHHIELDAGRSSQATLLGRKDKTVESLYLSPALTCKVDLTTTKTPQQLSFFEQLS